MADSRKLVKTSTKGIYRRGESYLVRYRDPGGKERKRCARTLAQARAIQAELRADISRGEFRATSRMTLPEYASTWMESYTGRTSSGIRPDTLKRYRADVENVVLPYFGKARLAEIEPRHVKAFVVSLFAKGLSEGRVRNIYAPLSALFKTAVEEGVIRFDPTQGVRRTTVNTDDGEEHDEVVFAYTADELHAFFDVLPDEHKLFGRFLAQTGLRISEVLALRWKDIDFGSGHVKVSRRLYQGTFAPPKTRYGRRRVPLNADLSRDLWQTRKDAPDPTDNAPLFPSATGGYREYSNVYNRILRPAQQRAGLRTGAHVLRHTCATMLFRSGWNAKQVQVFLGHHSPAFTLATYVHLLSEDLPAVPAFASASGMATNAASADSAGTFATPMAHPARVGESQPDGRGSDLSPSSGRRLAG